MNAMLKTLLLVSPLALAAALPGPTDLGPLDPERPLAELFPATTVAYAELAEPAALLDRAVLDALMDRATGEGLLDAAGRAQVLGGLAIAGFFVGGDALELGRHVLAHGVALGVAPAEGWGRSKPSWGLVLRGDDEEVLLELLDRAFEQLEQRFDAAGQLGEPHGSVRGADLWQLGEELVLARHGATLFASGDRGYLDDLLARAAGEGESLTGRDGFGLGADATARLWLDRAGAEELDPGDDALTRMARAPHLPQIQFLLGAGLAELATARSFALGLDLGPDGVSLELTGHEPAERTGLAPTAAAPPRRLRSAATHGSALLYRDLDGIVAGRNELFAPELQPRFTKALGDLALLFGGMEIDEDLLPALDPWIELGVAELDFAGTPRPELALPGLVALMRVDPTRERNMLAGFQTAVSISNAERAQNGQPPFALLLSMEGQATISAGHMPAPMPGEPVDASYNLAPACAFHDGYLVLGTHEAIVRAALRDLAAGTDERATGADGRDALAPVERLALAGPPLAALVDANTEYLVMQAVLNEGKLRSEAETETRVLAAALRAVEAAELTLTDTGERLTLALDLALAEPLVLAAEEAGQ